MENAELIKALRWCADNTLCVDLSTGEQCPRFKYREICKQKQQMHEVADALEAAEKRITIIEEERDLERFAAKNYLDKIDELKTQLPKEGEWLVEEIDDDSGFKWCKWRCSVCHEVVKKGWQHTKDGEKPKWKYCPNCGAKMTFNGK